MHYKKYSFPCPHCQKNVALFLDLSVMRGRQVEECAGCGRSIEVKYEVKDGDFANVTQQELEKK